MYLVVLEIILLPFPIYQLLLFFLEPRLTEFDIENLDICMHYLFQFFFFFYLILLLSSMLYNGLEEETYWIMSMQIKFDGFVNACNKFETLLA